MEHVTVPKAIPKKLASYYSGALLAYQSGQTLAGLFMLRTCAEQWAYIQAPESIQADGALAAYAKALPRDFK